ncbi:MAG: hypothetical protein JRN15_12775, partial [Nitrososphaerota archaeon]|nr:hypothetical protein [Nitrososphaerota archaeon]
MSSGEPKRSTGILSLGFMLILLLVFGVYISYSTAGMSSGSKKTPDYGPCTSPYPSAPADTQTYFNNGTVANNGWLRVLVIPENSTGQICVRYSSGNLGNSYSGQAYASIEKATPNGSAFTPTPLVAINANPPNVSLFPGVNQTEVYTINSSAGSKGFYGVNMFQFCPSIPFAIGYQQSELNMSDF